MDTLIDEEAIQAAEDAARERRERCHRIAQTAAADVAQAGRDGTLRREQIIPEWNRRCARLIVDDGVNTGLADYLTQVSNALGSEPNRFMLRASTLCGLNAEAWEAWRNGKRPG
jgi:predicted phosphoribosyltransferase